MVDKDLFQKKLLEWYHETKRDLPWRRDQNPYYIWVSEIMLQQTRVDTVIPYYQNFINQFPTLEHLANAEEEQVLKVWEGLGYYSRARNLLKGVKEVQAKYNGIVPNQKTEILHLPGIGPYTAGAILSIAYGKKEPAVDGNVMRVISRIFHLFDDITKAKTRLKIENLVLQLIPEEEAGSFNQALMELGALVCTPKSPQCLICPMMDLCEGRKEGDHEDLPVKATKKAIKAIHRLSLVIETEQEVFLVKRPDKGLLAKMWEVPSLESQDPLTKNEWEEMIDQMYGFHLKLDQAWMNVQHTFTHLHWNMIVYRIGIEQLEHDSNWPKQWVLFKKAELHKLSFPKAYHNVIRKIIE